MEKTKLRLYFVEGFLLAALLITLIMSGQVTNISLAILLLIVAIVVRFSFKKKKILSLNQTQANILLVISGVIYLGVFYLVGILGTGLVQTNLPLSWWTVRDFIIPIAVIVCCTEYIRLTLLSQDDRIYLGRREVHLGKVLTFVNMVLIDLILYTRVYDFNNFSDLLVIIGFVLFSSVACNLFYDYFAVRYGIKGLIIYRLILSLYMYILPVTPDMQVFLRAGVRMLYPYLLYLVFEHTYSKEYYKISFRDKREQNVVALVLVMVLVVMMGLISCQFRYGLLVIGSDSMQGAIDVGDAILTEQYSGQDIQKGSIVVFNSGGLKVAHRVVEMRLENNEMHYYTKGDNNEKNDDGYRTDADLIGVVLGKIPYVGLPSLWLRNMFNFGVSIR